MASSIMRWKHRFMIKVARSTKAILSLATLGTVFFIIYMAGSSGPGDNIPHDPRYMKHHYLTQPDIKYFLKLLDSAGNHISSKFSCPVFSDNDELFHKVSIIITYTKVDFNMLPLMLEALQRYTPISALSDVLVIQEGKMPGPDDDLFIKDLFKNSNTKHYRWLKAESNARFAGGRMARKPYIVFMSAEVAPEPGWLGPLLLEVSISRDIAIPHSDNLLHKARFHPIDDPYIHTLTWTLQTLAMPSKNDPIVPTPVMRGEVVAVSKSFYESIGEYDDKLTEGADLELSLRTWMCGSSVKIVRCSRVAAYDTLAPKTVVSDDAASRIVSLWVGSHTDLIRKQRQSRIENLEESVMSRRLQLKQLLGTTCKTFDWYLSYINPVLQLPFSPIDVVRFGMVRSELGECLSAEPSLSVTMCKPFLYQTQLVWELDWRGNLRHGKARCIGVENSVLYLGECPLNGNWFQGADGRILHKEYDVCLFQELEKTVSVRTCGKGDSRAEKWSWISV